MRRHPFYADSNSKVGAVRVWECIKCHDGQTVKELRAITDLTKELLQVHHINSRSDMVDKPDINLVEREYELVGKIRSLIEEYRF